MDLIKSKQKAYAITETCITSHSFSAFPEPRALDCFRLRVRTTKACVQLELCVAVHLAAGRGQMPA